MPRHFDVQGEILFASVGNNTVQNTCPPCKEIRYAKLQKSVTAPPEIPTPKRWSSNPLKNSAVMSQLRTLAEFRCFDSTETLCNSSHITGVDCQSDTNGVISIQEFGP